MVAIVPPSLLVLLRFFALPPVVHSVPRGGSISEGGDIFCAGWNNHGQLADGTTEDLKGDGPSPDDPIGRTKDPIIVGTKAIDGILLDVALGNDAGLPPQPSGGPPTGAPGDAPPGDALPSHA